MTQDTTNIYGTLRLEEYKQYVEKKGNFDYLSWAVAWDKVKIAFPMATYKSREYNVILGGNTYILPYMMLPNHSAMVKVDIWITDKDGNEEQSTMELAVRDNRNNAVTDPDAAQVENSIRRCLAKAVSSMTGFGIELWFGEDIKGLDYTKETHFTGAKLVLGNATSKQTRKLDELRRSPDCSPDDAKRIQVAKDGNWDLSEAHAQIMINDVSEGIKGSKKPTKTRINAISKLIDSVDMNVEKKVELKEYLGQELTTSQLDALETKLNNKLETQ
tara:strand:- start:4255 stop:5073 length:819 start_codon:yes stop_codon:yes gene_type:complete